MDNGKRKQVWFNSEQLVILEELRKLTLDTGSKIVRDSMKLYLKQLTDKNREK